MTKNHDPTVSHLGKTEKPTDFIRLILVDDQALVRAGFRLVLDATPGMEIVAEASTGEEAVAAAHRVPCDVVLMDIRMPGMDGLAATEKITTSPHAPRVLVLTTFGYDDYAVAAIRAGASGFLVKDARPSELLESIRAVHAGDSVLKPNATAKLVYELAQGVGAPDTAVTGRGHHMLAGFTPRELDVLERVAAGLNNKELAEHFVVSEATVKTHINRLLAKSGSRDRVQLVLLAITTGLVVP